MKLKNYTTMREVVRVLRQVNENLPVQFIVVLLEVARAGDEGLSVSQVKERTGLSQASASRHCRMLLKRATPTKDGYDIGESFEDSNDFRSRLYRLNKRGKALMEQLEEKLSEVTGG